MKRGRRGGRSGAWFIFFIFPLPSHVILKSISISSDGLSSVEEVHCEQRKDEVISIMNLAKQNTLRSPFHVGSTVKLVLYQ